MFVWNYVGNFFFFFFFVVVVFFVLFFKYLDNYCQYQYCVNDTQF